MTDKIQMTEKQARFKNVKDFCDFCFIVFGIMPKPEEIEAAQLSGYILKSDLQKKVEEAEEVINQIGSIIKNCKHEERICLVWKDSKKLFEAFNLLKQSHPEFKK